ncbi:RNA polymerase sigma factor rpoD, partial [mine drainage metagenome]
MASELDLHWYLDEIRKFPLLTAEQERALARQIREQGDPTSRQEMIRCNLRLVVSIARRYVRRGVSLIDLVAEGNIGLVRAVDLFDPNKEVRFSTYATWWVRQAIRKALTLNGRPIRLPTYMSQRIARLQGETTSSRNDNGEAMADVDLAT